MILHAGTISGLGFWPPLNGSQIWSVPAVGIVLSAGAEQRYLDAAPERRTVEATAEVRTMRTRIRQ